MKGDSFIMTLWKFARKIAVLLVLAIASGSLLSGCVNMEERNPVVTIEFDPEAYSGIGGTVTIELYPEAAPNTVSFFIDLLYEYFYNGINVTKVIPNTVVQIGDLSHTKNQEKMIDGEFSENGYTGETVKFERGVVGMARYLEEDYNSAVGEIFIVLDDEGAADLDGKYAAFGRVISGLEILDEISLLKSYMDSLQPMASVRTKKTSIDLKGRTYPHAVTKERPIKYFPGKYFEE